MVNAELIKCGNCGRVVDEKWHNCVHCGFRLFNKDGTLRVKPNKKQ